MGVDDTSDHPRHLFACDANAPFSRKPAHHGIGEASTPLPPATHPQGLHGCQWGGLKADEGVLLPFGCL